MTASLMRALCALTLALTPMLGAAQSTPPPAAPAPPAAGPTDALQACIAEAATPADRRTLVRWIFAVVTRHPDLADIGALDAGRRTALERDAARVVERLIADDCTVPTREAMVAGDQAAFEAAFRTLGELAMQDFLTHPEVQSGMAGIGEQVDSARILRALLTK